MPNLQQKHALVKPNPHRMRLPDTITTELIAQIANRGGIWYPLDDQPINGQAQSYARVIHPAVSQLKNICVNGTFSDTSVWVLGSGWAISGGVLTGTATTGNASQSALPITFGRAYMVTFTILTLTGGTVRFNFGGVTNGTTRSAVGTYSEIVTPASAMLNIQGVSAFSGTIDNVSVVEVNLPASLPIASVAPNTILADGDMEQVGVGAWTAANAAILTKDSTVTHSGSQSLKVAYNGTNNPAVIQSVLVSGQPYRITGYVRSDGTVTPRVWIGGTIQFTGTNKAGYWQPFDIVGVAGSAVFIIDGFGAGAGNFFNADEITITPMSGQSAIQLLGDGDMELSGTAFWTAGNSATLTKDSGSPHGGTQALKVAYNGVTNPSATQSVLNTAKLYHITGWVKGDGTAIPRVADNGGGVVFQGTSSTTWQSFDVYYKPSGAVFTLFAITTTAATFAEFDDIVIVEVPIPLQLTTPFQLLADGDMEASGTAAWTVSNNATLSKQSNTPHSGSQVLRVARNGTNNPIAFQNILVAGKSYRVTGYCRSDGSASPKVANNSGANLFTGAASTVWQPFDVVFVADGAVIVLEAVTSTGTQYAEFDDITVSPENGIRQDSILATLDGDMEQSGTSYWTAASATLSKQNDTPHGGTQYLRITKTVNGAFSSASQLCLCTGKTYRITGWGRGDGTTAPRVATTVQLFLGTSSTSWQFFDVTFVAPSTSISLQTSSAGNIGTFADFDDITITELSPLVAKPVGSPTMSVYEPISENLGIQLNGSTQYLNIFSNPYNGVISGDEGTVICIIQWPSIASMATLLVQTFIRVLFISGAVNDFISIGYDGSPQTLNVTRTDSVGTLSRSTVLTVNSRCLVIGMTYSLSGNSLRLYINGVQVGADVTGLNAFNAGAGDSTNSVIGAANTTPVLPSNALLSNIVIMPIAESAAFMQQFAQSAGGVR